MSPGHIRQHRHLELCLQGMDSYLHAHTPENYGVFGSKPLTAFHQFT